MAKKRKSTSTNPTILSQDITIEIFSRLRVKSLMRFKCLSKFYNSLVSESYLVDMHQRHSMSNHLGEIKFFVLDVEGFYSTEVKKGGKVSRCNLDFRYDDLSYANGMLCFWLKKKESVRIFNPGTREVKQLHYPLRKLKELHLSSDYECRFIVSFDLKTENFKTITLCNALRYQWRRDYKLVELKGKLAIQKRSSKSVKLWILGDPHREDWKSYTICFPPHLKNIITYKIFSCCDCYDVTNNSWYDVTKKRWKYLKISSFSVTDWIEENIYTYVKCLFPLKKIRNVS
ncbi:putative F-box protein At1g46984 [Capsicum annuum]|uniref:putative F-box protein At1g46984 n=1 Tax=Capsicum annuum TaxID=4072 RepID=UPI0007BEF19C|nr:putative F-box protein At1g46984 [Capsicum annuum]